MPHSKPLAMLALLLALGPPAEGADLFSVSIETLGGYLHTTETPYFENEIIVEEELAWAKGVVVRAENKLVGEVDGESEADLDLRFGGELEDDQESDDVILTDEITLEGRVFLLDFLWAGPALKFFLREKESSFAMEAVVALTYTVPGSGTALKNENKLRYNLSDEDILYLNEVDASQPLRLSSRTTLFIALENDLTVGKETENTLLLGPGITVGLVSMYSNYVMELTGEGGVLHGVEGGLVVEL